MLLIFSILNIIWSNTFLQLWKRKEKLFATEYGQEDDMEEKDFDRPSFTGVFIRSFYNDNLNEEYFSPKKRFLRMGIFIFN